MADLPRHHRPALLGDAPFQDLVGDVDPAERTEAADRAASLLVRGPRDPDDAVVVDRVVRLAEIEGLDEIAALWSGSPWDSLAGCLWRLYLLRSWVYADPAGVAREYEAGRSRAPVARVVAGVADPPGPDELRAMIDEVLRGIADREFADVLFRAAAFARVVATGRAGLTSATHDDVVRMLALAEQLEASGHQELSSGLA